MMRMVTVCTVLPPPERPRIDAAGDGCFDTLHADSLREALYVARRRRVDAVIISVHRCQGEALPGVARLVPRDQRDRGNGGPRAHKARHAGQGLALAAMHRDDHGIYAPAARDVQRLTQGIGMQGIEAAVTRRVETRARRRRENRAYRDHAHHGTARGSTVDHRDRITWRGTSGEFPDGACPKKCLDSA